MRSPEKKIANTDRELQHLYYISMIATHGVFFLPEHAGTFSFAHARVDLDRLLEATESFTKKLKESSKEGILNFVRRCFIKRESLARLKGIPVITRVISRKEPIEPISWAWVVQLRENEKLKKVYDVDPYAEVFCFKENVYSIYTESADGMGDSWTHLIIGLEKAMLIDTSFGIGNLKGLVDKLTGDMPLIVANTHHHIDHAYGNCQFGRVYCHEYSVPYLKQQRNPHAWDHLYDEKGKGIWLEFDKKDIIPYKEYEIVGCPNNYIFDLGGGHEVELIFMPGHAPGGCCYLDKKNRILFAGDTLLSMRVSVGGPRAGMPYSKFSTVTRFRNELAKLASRSDEFDSVFPGHFILDIDKSVVQNMLDACNAVIADPDCFDYTEINTHGREMKMKKVKGLGTLSYNNSSV